MTTEEQTRTAVDAILDAAEPRYAIGFLTGRLGRLLRTKIPKEQHANMIAQIAEGIGLSASGADLSEEARKRGIDIS